MKLVICGIMRLNIILFSIRIKQEYVGLPQEKGT